VVSSNYEDRYFKSWDMLENAAMKITAMLEGTLWDHCHRSKTRQVSSCCALDCVQSLCSVLYLVITSGFPAELKS